MWVLAYMKHIFWAGMKTTQRCESINSFFDGYVQRQTMLHEFGPQYFAAVEARVDAEEKADADCERNVLELVSDFRIEIEFQRVYTTAKFYEFQVECMKLMYVHVPEQRKISECLVDHVVEDRIWCRDKNLRKDVPTERTCQYSVTLNVVTRDAWCTCKLFECHGIMCRHLIEVFDVQKVRKLPTMLILDRWRKDIERPYTKIKIMFHDPEQTEVVLRLDRMQFVFDSVSLIAAEDDDDTEKLIEILEEAKEKLIQARAEASRSKAGENVVCGDICNAEPNSKALSSKEGENMISEGGKEKNTTPPSVGNKRRAPETVKITPPSVNRVCVTKRLDTTPGAAESTGVVAAPSDSQVTLSLVKDPPLPKNPRNRPIESRYKSAVELNTTAKGKGKTAATKAKRGQAKQIELCTLQLQQQQAQLDLFLKQQASLQQATLQLHQAQQQQQQQQMTSAYGWRDYSNFPIGTQTHHVTQQTVQMAYANANVQRPTLISRTPPLQRPLGPVGNGMLQAPPQAFNGFVQPAPSFGGIGMVQGNGYVVEESSIGYLTCNNQPHLLNSNPNSNHQLPLNPHCLASLPDLNQ